MSRSIAFNPAAAAVVACVLMLPACRDAQQSSMPSTGDAAPTATEPAGTGPAPMPEEEAPAMPGPPTTMIPDDIVVSTNEPFWNARVEDGEIVLTGAGQPERRLTVESVQVTGDSSTIRASDANGNLLIEVRSQACQDSMSGAGYPFTGSLAFDGGAAIMGCARPASMPAPGEPGTETDDDENPVAFQGEGQQWSAVRTLELLDGDKLAITAEGDRIERVRCSG